MAEHYFDCDKYAINTLKVLKSYSQNKTFTDIILIAGDKRIPAHRAILSANSEYLLTKFMDEPENKEMKIEEVDGEILETLVEYCYTGFIQLEENNSIKLFDAARLLQLSTIVDAYCQYLIKHLHPINCLGIRLLADSRECVHLSDVAHSYALDHFVEVVKYKEFLSLSVTHLTMFLESEDVNVPSEEIIFNALMTWLQHDLAKRSDYASKLFNCVKFPLLTPTFVYDQMKNNKVLTEKSAIKELIFETFTYYAVPERRLQLQSNRTRPRKSTIDETLLFIGSLSDNEGQSQTFIDVFSFKDNMWKNLVLLNGDLHLFDTAVLEKKLFILSGQHNKEDPNIVIKFDLSSLSSVDSTPMNLPRAGLNAAVLGKSLYAVGGNRGHDCSNTVEMWDSVTQKWSFVASMSTARSAAGIGVLNEKLYVVGGWNGKEYLNTVECYDPSQDRWSFCAPLQNCRGGLAVGVLNGCLYAIGGLCNSIYLDSVERYDPNTDTWTMVTRMSTARGFFGVGAMANRLFAVGGLDRSKFITVVETYDPFLNRWEKVAPLKMSSKGRCVVVKNSVINI